MKKRLIMLGISLCIGINLVACNKASQNQTAQALGQEAQLNLEQEDALEPEQNAKLILAVDNADYAEEIVKRFNMRYPEVEIEVQIKGRDEASECVKLDGPYEEGPDVFLLAHDHMLEEVNYGVLLPINQDIVSQVSKVVSEKALQTSEVDGIHYGLPLSQEVMVIYYNKAIVGNEPVKTFEQLLEFAKTYTDQSKDQYGFLMNIRDAYSAYGILSAYGFDLFGKEGKDEEKPGIETEAFKKGLAFIQELKSVMPVSIKEINHDFVRNHFMAGKAAYIYDGPWAYEQYRQAGIECGVMEVPNMNGNILSPFGGSINVHISSYTKYPHAATLLAAFMAEKEGAEILYQTTKSVPSLQDISYLKGIEDDEMTRVCSKQFETAKIMPSNKRIQYYWSLIPETIESVFEGSQTPEKAQETLIKEWEDKISSEYFGK